MDDPYFDKTPQRRGWLDVKVTNGLVVTLFGCGCLTVMVCAFAAFGVYQPEAAVNIGGCVIGGGTVLGLAMILYVAANS